MSDLFNQERTEKKGIAQNAYQELISGQIDRATLEANVAIDISLKLSDYPIRPYPVPSPGIRDYVQGRQFKTKKREPSESRLVGEWLLQVRTTAYLNKADFEVLLCARNICRNIGQHENAKLINQSLERYDYNRFDTEMYSKASEVQVLDSLERRHAVRGE